MENTKKCPFCAEEINIEAIKCKHCGSMLNTQEAKELESWKKSIEKNDNSNLENKKLSPETLVIIFVFLPIIFWLLVWYFLFSSPNKQLQNIKENVVIDFEEQYNIAKDWWNLMDICLNAWIVKAWYLQVKDEYNYNKWIDIEKEDCKNAGINY